MEVGTRASENRSASPQSTWKRGLAIATAMSCVLACVSEPEPEEAIQSLRYPGDINLGGLFPVHGKGRNGQPCGQIQTEFGLRPLEAMLFSIKKINNDSSFLPGIKLGMIAFDTCANEAYSLKQSLAFAKTPIVRKYELRKPELPCSNNSTSTDDAQKLDDVVAVIGAGSSDVAKAVASFLTALETPLVSYLATSPFLSDKERFAYFFRTVPSDEERARALMELLRKFEWTYVSFVYSDNTYGRQGQKILENLVKNYGICFASMHRMNTDETTEYEKIIDEIEINKDLEVVLVFADEKKAKLLLTSAHSKKLKRIRWIFSDTWITGEEVRLPHSKRSHEENRNVLEGALAIQPLEFDLKGFDSYFKSLNHIPENENPWLNGIRRKSGESIKDKEPNAAGTGPNLSSALYLHFVRDAVYAVAHALKNMHESLCRGEKGVCPRMKPVNGSVLKDFLQNVSFPSEDGKEFKFIEGSGPPRYSILQFQNEKGTLQWVEVGYYTHEDGSLQLKIDENKLVNGSTAKLNFTCKPSCVANQVMKPKIGKSSCWSCSECGKNEIRVGNTTCLTCEIDKQNRKYHESCTPTQLITFGSPWTIVIVCLAGFGMLSTVLVGGVYWMYWDTPLIKASGRELSYLLLFGIFASFLTSIIIIVSEPTKGVCGGARFLVGFCLTLCYAAILARTNRIARIFTQKNSQIMGKLRYTSPRSQLVITTILTLVEVIINVSWLIFMPPKAIYIMPNNDARLLVCNGFTYPSSLVCLLYPFILIAICTVNAFMARKCPDGFNETKHIAFANYTTITTWLTILPFYLTFKDREYISIAFSLATSVSSLMHLACLFLPKLYIVLLKPHKNTKEYVMTNHKPTTCLPSPQASGGSCSHQGSSSKESQLDNSTGTQEKKKYPPVKGSNLYSRFRCEPVNDESVQSTVI